MSQTKNPEKEILEKKRAIFIKLIEKAISSNNNTIKERKKEEKKIKHLEEMIKRLTEYKKEVEDVKDLSKILKVWLNILEDEKSGLHESIWYGVLDRKQKTFENQIELYPEEGDRYKILLDRAITCKKMLIEGNDFITSSGKWMEPLNKTY